MGTAVGRFHRRALTQQQEPAVNLELTVQIAPRVGLYSNQGLVELGAYEINKLRRPARVPFYEWTAISAVPLPQNRPKGPGYDRMKLAHEYQSMLDSGVVKTKLQHIFAVSRTENREAGKLENGMDRARRSQSIELTFFGSALTSEQIEDLFQFTTSV